MERETVMKRLRDGGLLFDGAMGTYASAMEDFPDGAVEAACLTAPELIRRIHRSYLDAGCHAIKTNTFAAHVGLAAPNDEAQRAIISAACRIAREAAASYQAAVFADIGPAPMDGCAAEHYCRMSEVFLDEQAECFLFETLPSFEGVAEAIRLIKSRNPRAFAAVSFAVNPDGYTRTGEEAAALIRAAAENGDIDAVGFNCVCGAYHMKKIISRIAHLTDKPLLAMPNAGYPHVVNGRTYYQSEPDYFAQQTALCAASGVQIFGGCCGTTPEHILALRHALKRNAVMAENKSIRGEDKALRCASPLKEKLERGERLILVELDPPDEPDAERFLKSARLLHQAGADAITIADCPIGRASMDASILACKLKREMGIEPLPHMTCRDRNVNATKALLLGLAMENIRQVLVVTGDPVPSSDRETVKSVFQFHSLMLARFVRSLEKSVSPFFLCGALNINAVNFEQELRRAREKEAAGIEAFLTQPVLSRMAVENIKTARKTLHGAIIGGLFPIVSKRNACFMRSEVSGVAIDDEVISAYEGLDREQGERLARRLCSDAAKAIASYVDGYYIMTPFMRTALASAVIEDLKEI